MLVAVAARAALDSMRAASAMARLVAMRELVALVEQAAQRARLAPTPRRSSAALAASAATPGLLVLVRRVPVARMETSRLPMPRMAAPAERAVRARMAVPAERPVSVWLAAVPRVMAGTARRAAMVAPAASAVMAMTPH